VLRVLAFIRRLPGVAVDDFRRHYEEVHVATALPLLGGIAGYERQHVREAVFGEPAFDCMSRFDWRDAAAAAAAFARIEGPAGDAIRADERRFMDAPANVVLPVETGPAWQAGDPAGARARLLVCLRRPRAEDAARFRARCERERLAGLRAAPDGVRFCRAHWSLAPAAPPGGFDAVVELAADGPGGLAAWAQAFAAEGAQAIAARVSVHATPLAA
jgi:uncharacterized protein (TIGR02118 family)